MPRILVSITCLFFMLVASADAISQRLMSMPRKYVNGPDGFLLQDHSRDVDEKELWVVASDRDGNRTYESPGGSLKKMVRFMDRFYVADEQGEYLRLVKLDFNAKDSRNRITKSAEDMGWVRKDRLLLWPSCLINDIKLSRKALPVISSQNLYDPKSFLDDENNVRIYEDPEMTKISRTTIKLFQILFVYKEVGNAILVGRAARTQSGTMQNDILGWVNKNIVQLWNDRMCLQPNQDPDAVAERKSRGIQASLWASSADATTWAREGKGSRQALWDRDTYEDTWEPHRKRYPVFANQNGIIKSGFETDIFDEKGRDQAKVDEAARVSKEGSEMTEQIRQVNLIFVVDAGAEMSEYVNMASSVVERMAARNADGSKNVIKYGAVVYRDSADVSCGRNIAVTRRELTSTSADITAFMAEQAVVKGCKTGNKALNQGLMQALYMLGRSKRNQTNLVILLCGAGGNDRNSRQYGDAVIQRMIGESRAYLCVLQVSRASRPEFEDVVPRYKRVFENACQATYDADKQQLNSFFKLPESLPPRVLFEKMPGANIFNPIYPRTSPLMGMIGFAGTGNAMSIEQVYTGLDSLLQFALNDVDRKAEFIVSKISGIESEAYKIDPSVAGHLIEIFGSFDNKKLAGLYMGKKFQFFVPAYTSITVSGLTHPVYQRVIFTSQDEYDNLVRSMSGLQGEPTLSETRKRIVQTYITQLALILGDARARSEIEKGLELGAMLERYVTGIKPKSELMNRKIKDLADPRVVNDSDLGRIQESIRRSHAKLKNVIGNPNMVMSSELGVYFWIPEDYFP
jgi:hypothetical protein